MPEKFFNGKPSAYSLFDGIGLIILGIWILLATLLLEFANPEKLAHFHWMWH